MGRDSASAHWKVGLNFHSSRRAAGRTLHGSIDVGSGQLRTHSSINIRPQLARRGLVKVHEGTESCLSVPKVPAIPLLFVRVHSLTGQVPTGGWCELPQPSEEPGHSQWRGRSIPSLARLGRPFLVLTICTGPVTSQNYLYQTADGWSTARKQTQLWIEMPGNVIACLQDRSICSFHGFCGKRKTSHWSRGMNVKQRSWCSHWHLL